MSKFFKKVWANTTVLTASPIVLSVTGIGAVGSESGIWLFLFLVAALIGSINALYHLADDDVTFE